MVEHLMWLIIAGGVLAITVGLWFLVSYWLTPHIRTPDGKARITGRCGDTMEIALKFNRDKVVNSASWTDGCAYSLNCVCAAAELAKGKTPDEILDIDANLIQKAIGGLPKDQMHCAELAAEILQAALEDFMLKNSSKPRSAPQ